ncbi:MAG: GYD domain-containing protein [Armatimonadetes bacterium]|nr:GYD domain-containing protein [Armatimonadota bacterium]
MAKFVSLMRFTEQGVKAVQASPERAEANRALAAQFGVEVEQILWIMGAYDILMILEAPDDETVGAFLLSMISRGNVAGQTMRAYEAEEFAALTSRMA